MPKPKLSRLELRVMDVLWTRGASSIREVHEVLPKRGRPAYTTVQTIVNRLEAKEAVRRTKKIGNAHIFEATITRDSAERRLIDDLLAMFGGSSQPLMARLIEAGKLTLDDIRQAENTLQELADKEKQS
jgi:BlaI family transcriptional regulator, penicillinase repressor